MNSADSEDVALTPLFQTLTLAPLIRMAALRLHLYDSLPSARLGLRYEDVRRVAAPEQMILGFFERTYEAGATLAAWDRAALARKTPQNHGRGEGE